MIASHHPRSLLKSQDPDKYWNSPYLKEEFENRVIFAMTRNLSEDEAEDMADYLWEGYEEWCQEFIENKKLEQLEDL